MMVVCVYMITKITLYLTRGYLAASFSTWEAHYYSLYYWLHYIPKERFLLIRTEELSNHSKILHQLASFLDLPWPVNGITHSVTGTYDYENQGVSAYSNSSLYMSPETERILVEFFTPYNKQLATLLNDEHYLWKEQTYS